VRAEPLGPPAAAPPRDPIEARPAAAVHAHLTALPGLLAAAELAEAHVEARDRRTGALVAYSFVTIDRAPALLVAEAVRVGLARLDIEPSRDESTRDARGASEAAAPASLDDRPGQYL
jgi:hypothetical protein